MQFRYMIEWLGGTKEPLDRPFERVCINKIDPVYFLSDVLLMELRERYFFVKSVFLFYFNPFSKLTFLMKWLK